MSIIISIIAFIFITCDESFKSLICSYPTTFALYNGNNLLCCSNGIYTYDSNFEKELSSMTETAEENSVNESDKETSTENNEKNIYKNETYYYKSKFNNIDGLKDYLSNFLIESRVNEMTKIKPLKNIELLQNETYKDSNYVLHNNKLYCKIIDIKNESRYISNYTNEIKPYEIKTIKIRTNKITFLVTSKYLKDEIKDFNTECKDNIDKCIRTDDQSFSIELVDGSWLVSMFNIHE